MVYLTILYVFCTWGTESSLPQSHSLHASNDSTSHIGPNLLFFFSNSPFIAGFFDSE